MTDLSEQKAAMRKIAFANRKTANGHGFAEAANRNLLGHLALFPMAEIISGYMPIRTEISPVATMTILHGQGKRICVPVIQGAGKPLLFREWTPESTMVEGPFGASVPAKGEDLEPDVLIAPLVAFDRRGYRLGYGGGFYDRSFERLRAVGKGLGIGFAYAGQELPEVPTEPTDQRLDAIVTETLLLRFDR